MGRTVHINALTPLQVDFDLGDKGFFNTSTGLRAKNRPNQGPGIIAISLMCHIP